MLPHRLGAKQQKRPDVMAKTVGESSSLPVSSAVSVLKFVFNTLVRSNLGAVFAAACLGTLSRMLGLLSLVVALKGIIIAIDAKHFSEALQELLQERSFDITLTSTRLMVTVIGVLIVIQCGAIAAGYKRFASIAKLQRSLLDDLIADRKVVLDNDKFAIEKIVPAIDTFIRLLEISMFSILIIAFLAFVSPAVLLFLITVFICIALFVPFSDRRRLRIEQDRKVASQKYKRSYPKRCDEPESMERWIKNERHAYVQATLRGRKHQLQSQQLSNLAVSGGIGALIVYLYWVGFPRVEPSLVPLPLLFIILAIRQLIVYANEFGKCLSTLLELRAGLHIVRGTSGSRP